MAFKQLTYHAMRLPWPLQWEKLFGHSAPLMVEIGFGHGKFLAQLAVQNPDCHIIGIERAQRPIKWAQALLRKPGQEIPNVRLIDADAFMAFHVLFQPEQVSAFHLNFSDPWPKKRHHHRRLIDAEFLQVLVSRLKIGGLLYMATDIADYAGQIHDALTVTSGLENAYDTSWVNAREKAFASVVTHYEKKAIQVGRTCYYFKWRRTAKAESLPYPLPIQEFEFDTMPNITLHIPADVETIATGFEKWVHRTPAPDNAGERIVSFLSVYVRRALQEKHYPELLFEVFIEEPLFTQHLMLVMVEREPRQYLIKTSSVGFPRATAGLHDAVNALADRILKHHPEARILKRTTRPSDYESGQEPDSHSD